MNRKKLFLLIGALTLNMYMPFNVKALENQGAAENNQVPVYDFIYTFNGGIARVEKNGKYGFINMDGKIVTEPKYTYAYDFDITGNYAKVVIDNEVKYINKEGEIVDESSINFRKKLPPEEYKKFCDKHYIESIKEVDGGEIVVDEKGNTLIDQYRNISFEHNDYGEGIYRACTEESYKRIDKLTEQGIDFKDYIDDEEVDPFGYNVFDIKGKKLSPYEYDWLASLNNWGTLYGKVYGKDEVHWIDCKKGIIKKEPYRQHTSPHSKIKGKAFAGYSDEGVPIYREEGKLYDYNNNDITNKFVEINKTFPQINTDDYYMALIVPDNIRDSLSGLINPRIVTKDIRTMLFYLDGTPISPKEYSFFTGFGDDGKMIAKPAGKPEMDIIDFEKGIVDTFTVNMKEDKNNVALEQLLSSEGVIKYIKTDRKNGANFAVMNGEGNIIAEYINGFGHYPLGDVNSDDFDLRSLVSIGNIAGIREKNSTLEEDIKVLNKRFANKVGYTLVSRSIFNNGAVLLWGDPKGQDYYNYVVRRDNQGFVTIGMRDWHNQTCFSDDGYNMSDLNVVLEILKYYAGKDGEGIFQYLNNKFLSYEKIDFDRKIKIGDTTIVITDPISYKGFDNGYKDIDVHILTKEEESRVNIANLDLEKIDVSKVQLSDENEIVKEEIKRNPKNTPYEDGQLFNEKFKGKNGLKFDKNGGMLKKQDVLFLRREKENPIITLCLWPNRTEKAVYIIDKFAFEIVPVFKEVVQYYAENPKDAQAIFDFVDEYYGYRKPIDMTKIYKFGDTRIKFRKEDKFNAGLEIVFLGKEK
jgi:hypothetical protein